MDVKGHHQQEEHIGYGQVEHVDVRHHALLAHFDGVDDQSVGDDAHGAQDAIDGGEDVHEGGDVHETVGRRAGRQARRLTARVVALVVVAENHRVVHGSGCHSIPLPLSRPGALTRAIALSLPLLPRASRRQTLAPARARRDCLPARSGGTFFSLFRTLIFWRAGNVSEADVILTASASALRWS